MERREITDSTRFDQAKIGEWFGKWTDKKTIIRRTLGYSSVSTLFIKTVDNEAIDFLRHSINWNGESIELRSKRDKNGVT